MSEQNELVIVVDEHTLACVSEGFDRCGYRLTAATAMQCCLITQEINDPSFNVVGFYRCEVCMWNYVRTKEYPQFLYRITDEEMARK